MKDLISWFIGLTLIIMGFALIYEFVLEFFKLIIGLIALGIGFHFLNKKKYRRMFF